MHSCLLKAKSPGGVCKYHTEPQEIMGLQAREEKSRTVTAAAACALGKEGKDVQRGGET